MKRVAIAAAVSGLLVMQLSVLPALAAPQLFGRDKKPDITRLLLGKVMDNNDNPLPNAVVYLTNTRDHSVKTYIVGAEGTYRFPALQPNIDYEVYAQLNKRKSHTKTVSQFDNRTQVYIDLKIDANKEPPAAK
ncbi:MAG: carboxypeptidase-like regulatory domain-containing protein [Terriglobales bacterium]